MSEIPIPEQPKTKNYYKEHVCKSLKTKEVKNSVFMRESLDPKYFIGTCSRCGQQIIEKQSV